jgi:hypothetical protein
LIRLPGKILVRRGSNNLNETDPSVHSRSAPDISRMESVGLVVRSSGLASGSGDSARHMENCVGAHRALVQGLDRISRGRNQKVDIPSASLFLDLPHHRQRAVSTGAYHQPATPPRNLFHEGERGMSIHVAEPLRRRLLAFANLPPVDDEVVIVRHAVDLYGAERVLLETHLGSAPPGTDPTIP